MEQKLTKNKSAKAQSVHLRLPQPIIERLSEKADEEGLKLAALIRSVLHKFAEGKLK